MLKDILYTFLISASPIGEARLGIPYGDLNTDLPFIWVFIIGLSANLLVFPLFYRLIEFSNKHFLKNKWYKKAAIYLSLRARRKTGVVVQKYGAIGLMIFVMIPLPFTGAYIGTIAAYIFKINYKKALLAINIGVLIALTFISLGVSALF
tara:strand:- start:105 stop:554 length:450 start_codon:yes stop_codon:yes gene_type:complete